MRNLLTLKLAAFLLKIELQSNLTDFSMLLSLKNAAIKLSLNCVSFIDITVKILS
ncbi:hypothetical protein SAMN05216379_101163 [Nitrosomonas eutropha]|uniref:Uncharacterized protein n=1 Tax=Nitrosomonas eutropha TaxID=916 RepID=A0ABX5M769_9PROT|nr:hypothetical protein C8R14_1157 [Nitrosomonas eutropha]SCX01052.1 hypothetical protein SAMN05216379_101163 [Nitrosomonas eutropha]SEJ13164.1 hypothetical protein SAMN05216318_12628 [Nitrosomonas eutropha]